MTQPVISRLMLQPADPDKEKSLYQKVSKARFRLKHLFSLVHHTKMAIEHVKAYEYCNRQFIIIGLS